MGRTISISQTNELVVEIDCDTVDSFLDSISPNGSLLEHFPLPTLPCIFRGISSLNYGLVPTALRGENSVWGGYASQLTGRPHSFRGQLGWEQLLLRSFFLLSDAHGLFIPEDSQAFRKVVQRLGNPEYVDQILEGKKYWPPDELLSVIGLAQHYGLPTRLLDWSRDPYVAAFFASVESGSRKDSIKEESESDDSLAVWALNLQSYQVGVPPRGAKHPLRTLQQDLVIVRSPAALNDRLHAQQGLFSLYRPAIVDHSLPVHNVSLEDYLLPRIPSAHRDLQLFWRISLPARHSRELLRKLSRLGYTSAKLFPGFEGVVRALRQTYYSDTDRQWFNIASLDG